MLSKNSFKTKARELGKRLFPKKEHALYLLISFFISIFVWYAIIGREQIEAQYDIRLDYKSLPTGLVIREGMASKVSVRLRGPTQLLRVLNNRDLSYTVDLSGVIKGASVIPIELNTKSEFKAFEVIETNPPRLLLIAEPLVEKKIPLEALMMDSPNLEGLQVNNIKLSPNSTIARGAESLVEPLTRMLVAFNPGVDTTLGQHTDSVAIIAPPQVEIIPPIVRVVYTIERRTTQLDLQRAVLAEAPKGQAYKIKPNKVDLKLLVPEGKEKDAEYLAQIRVVVEPAGLEEETAQVSVQAPEGVTVLKVTPQTVKITK